MPLPGIYNSFSTHNACHICHSSCLHNPCYCGESGAEWSSSLCYVGDSLHLAEPDNLHAASDRNTSMQLCHVVNAAAPDGAVSLVSLILPPAGLCHVSAGFSLSQDRSREKTVFCFPAALRFLLENFYLDKQVRYIVTIYPVVILWLSGVLSNSGSPESHMFIFAGMLFDICIVNLFFCETLITSLVLSAASILGTSCILFVARIVLVTWRHYKQPLYSDSELSMSPVEISLTQSNIFLWLLSKLKKKHMCIVMFLVEFLRCLLWI